MKERGGVCHCCCYKAIPQQKSHVARGAQPYQGRWCLYTTPPLLSRYHSPPFSPLSLRPLPLPLSLALVLDFRSLLLLYHQYSKFHCLNYQFPFLLFSSSIIIISLSLSLSLSLSVFSVFSFGDIFIWY